ncbi:filamin-C-like isoform X1 [Asterias rubens]|uniref:filamin-C-like isoform X1 n=1 Tax=Asterias rubens TaxID=7604 RepID=UPI0014554E0B|nr:filamin-C-like isoform X1 [Asterias rubens]
MFTSKSPEIMTLPAPGSESGATQQSPDTKPTEVWDAQAQRWVEIQQKTFMNWCNEQLKPTGKRIENFRTDLEDGLVLIALVEQLTSSTGGALYKRQGRYCKYPKMRAQKLENVTHALQMIEKEGIKLVNIGTEDVVEGNVKLILGLIWRLIQKYQISTGSKQTKVPSKKSMLNWIDAVLPDRHISNFTTDWNDGTALSALINYCDPTLMTNFKSLNPSNSRENCTHAMQMAKDKFEVPMIVSPEDMCHPQIDELSGMTYLSYFLRTEGPGWYSTLNWVRKKVPELNVHNFQSDWNDGRVLCALAQAVAEGTCPEWRDLNKNDKLANCQKGLEAGKKLGIKPTLSAREFTTPDVDELGVMSYAARFQHTAPWPKENSYVLSEPPPPKVHWAECVQLTSVQVQDKVTPGHNALKNTIHGIVNVPVVLRLHVINTKATLKDIRAELQAPGQPVAISLKALASDQVDLTFVPLQEGLHKLSIWCRDDVIDGFPINLMIEPDKASFPKNIRIGTMSSASVGEQLQFQVDVSDAGYGELLVEINNGFNQLPVRIVRQGKVFTVHTQAKECGTYNVFIKWNGEDITEDPMKIEVHDASQCVATGEGLSRAKEDQPAVFTVDTRSAGKGELRVIVEGPHSIAKCSIDKNTSGTYTVTYIPVEVGLFSIKVTWNGKDIYGSPFHPKVTDPRKVRVVGGHVPGMGDNGIINMTHRKAYLLELSTAEAGPGKMVADLQLPSNRRVHLPIELEADGRATMRFVPEEEGDYMLRILWNDHLIKGSPYRMTCRQKRVPVDHTRVRCHGPGLQQSKVSQLSEFFIDGSQAGPGVPNLRMSGVKSDIMVTLIPQGNNIYKAVFTPDIAGAYLLHLTWSDRQVPGSPFKLNVADAAHANRVHASGAALKTIVANQTSRLVIDSREAGSGELTARCVGPNTMAEVHIGDNRNGTYSLLISPSEPGRHTLEVKYGEDHIQGSPFLLRVAAPPDASKVRCFGPGLEHGILSSFNGRFICETKGAGAGQLKVRIHGPKGAFKVEMRRSDTKDRTIDVRYNPNESGEYAIQVKWSDKHVPGSPFIVKVVENREELHALKRDMANGRQSSKDMTNGWSEEI